MTHRRHPIGRDGAAPGGPAGTISAMPTAAGAPTPAGPPDNASTAPTNRRPREVRYETRLSETTVLFDLRDVHGIKQWDTVVVDGRPLYPVAVQDEDGTVRVLTQVHEQGLTVSFSVSFWGPGHDGDLLLTCVAVVDKATITAHTLGAEDVIDLYLDGGLEAVQLLEQLLTPEDDDVTPVAFLDALTSVRASFDLPARGSDTCGGSRTPPEWW